MNYTIKVNVINNPSRSKTVSVVADNDEDAFLLAEEFVPASVNDIIQSCIITCED